MENMDISCGEVEMANESAMSVDEGMDVCSEYEKSSKLESAIGNLNTTVFNLSNSASCTSYNATSEMEDSVNTTVLSGVRSGFPNQQDNDADGLEIITRFPLGIAKDHNQANNSLNICKARINANSVKLNISNEMHQTEKENMFNKSWDRTFEFPSGTKQQSDKFPLDRHELASSGSQHGFEEAEEHFTSASDYIFSAADFDCLLSRGSSRSETAAVTASSSAASPSREVSTGLPRDSVLINFDPLLRRQTIAKADNNGPLASLEPTSPCLALIDFAQHQQQQQQQHHHQQQQQQQDHAHNSSIDTAPLVVPLLDTKDFEPGIVQQKEDSISVSTVSPEVTAEKLDQTLTTDDDSEPTLKVTSTERSEHQFPSEPEISDKTITELIESAGDSKGVDCLLNPPLNRIQDDTGSVWPLTPAEQLLHAGATSTEPNGPAISENEANEEHSEPLCPAASSSVVELVQFSESSVLQTEDLPRQQTDTTSVALCEIKAADAVDHSHESVGKEVEDSSEAAELFVSLPDSPLDVESAEYTHSIVEFASAPTTESHALNSSSNMLAEPLQEKQNSTIHNMSDERMVQHADEHVETSKKSKNEDINIADMEKKMHDVELREENMLKRITEKDKTISKMSNVVEAYERTIAELISEKEMLIRNHGLECESLKQDNEINAQHLESLEKTFSNLYAKYERMKKNAIKYKEHEENLLEKVTKLEECLRAQEQRYEKMKSHAMSQLEIANTKIDEAIRNHSQESAKLKAQIKKEELYRISINEQLIQKSKENEELVKICDELISETN